MDLLFAFTLTILAGLSTGFGGLIAFTKFASRKPFLSVSLGFSAGVMLYVSFVEILPKGIDSLAQTTLGNQAVIWGTLAFFLGIAFIMIIDQFLPASVNPHEIKDEKTEHQSLLRMGLFTAFALALHNLPEGLATLYASLSDARLGVSVTIAIALHNIPEGIAVAIPIFQATQNKKKAFLYSFLSGLAEPIGALIGFLIFSTFFPQEWFGLIFSFVGGIMVYISLDELLPTAEKYGYHHLSMIGLIAGMAIMAMSLLIF
jgi:ZIP family zinc transporter